MRNTRLSDPELLAPAGDFEKMQVAIAYGADAVYLSGTSFGLRASAKNFNENDLGTAIDYAHRHNVRVYVTANIFAHNRDISEMEGYFAKLKNLGADAFIISDPGVFSLARKEAPDVEIHISTQANTTNYASARFWHEMGASRIILARELSLNEIAEIRAKLSTDTTLEAFVHGAMCMSYSGRCLLSRYMTAETGCRDANLGACAHPCRYDYRLYAEEVSRPGQFMPIMSSEEHEHGTDIFGADDLCMVEHIPALINAGVESFKIEGRMKSAFYVGLATKAYRQAIDAALLAKSGSGGIISAYQESFSSNLDMLKMASHRPFSTGFYFDRPHDNTADKSYARTHNFAGLVRGYNHETGFVLIEQRGVFEVGDILTFVPPSGANFEHEITEMYNKPSGDTNRLVKISRAPHAQQMILVEINRPVEEFTLVCICVNTL